MTDNRITRQIRLALEKGQISSQDLQTLAMGARPANPDSWRELFPTYDELNETPEPELVIEKFVNTGEITVVGALPKHSKTWVMLSMSKAILSGEKWLGRFNTKKAERVLYLIPEAGMQQVKRRLVLMRLMGYVKEQRLLVAPRRPRLTLKDLTDPRILKASEGADVFLDTAVRFIKGDETVENIKLFADECLNIAAVARSVVIAHHSPKAFELTDRITLENVLRGSGDFGAMVSNCIGIRQLDRERNLIHVELCAGRDDDGDVKPFHLEGRPHINNTGDLKPVLWDAGPLSEHVGKARTGRPPKVGSDLASRIPKYKALGLTHEQIAEIEGVDPKTIQRAVKKSAADVAANQEVPF